MFPEELMPESIGQIVKKPSHSSGITEEREYQNVQVGWKDNWRLT